MREAQLPAVRRYFRQKKSPDRPVGAFCIRSLAMTYSRMEYTTLPSALNVFTSEFGMGSGGSRSLTSPGKPVKRLAFQSAAARFGMIRLLSTVFSVLIEAFRPLGCYMVKPHGQLVLVSFIHYCTSTPSLSTS